MRDVASDTNLNNFKEERKKKPKTASASEALFDMKIFSTVRVRLQDPGSSPYWGGNVARRENTPNRTLSFRYHKEKNKKERFPITSNARLPPPSGWKQTFPCPDTEMSKGKHYFQGDVFAMHCRSKPRDNDARQLRSSAPQGGQGRRRGATEGRPRGKRGETEGQGGPAACSPQHAARSTQSCAHCMCFRNKDESF